VGHTRGSVGTKVLANARTVVGAGSLGPLFPGGTGRDEIVWVGDVGQTAPG
jgi:hypothetical protein